MERRSSSPSLAAVVTGRSRAERQAGEAGVGRELEADERRIEPVDGGAAQHAPLDVEEAAVGAVDAEQLRHLLDEPLQHELELELARHRARRLQQRRLLAPAGAGSRSAAVRSRAPSRSRAPPSRPGSARRRRAAPTAAARSSRPARCRRGSEPRPHVGAEQDRHLVECQRRLELAGRDADHALRGRARRAPCARSRPPAARARRRPRARRPSGCARARGRPRRSGR